MVTSSPIYGKDNILMFRVLGDKAAAAKLSFQTEHKWKYSRKTDAKITKDGAINSDKGLEVTLEIKGVASRDELNTTLKNAVLEGKQIEVWDIDLNSNNDSDGKYDAEYAIGRLGSWEVPSNVEEFSEISTEMAIDGKPVKGKATFTKEQIKAIQYVFKDVTKIDESSVSSPGSVHSR